MVVQRSNTVALQHARHLLALLPGARVDDAGAGKAPGVSERATQPSLLVLDVLHLVAKVRPHDARAHHLELPPEALSDIALCRGRGGRGEAEHWWLPNLLQRRADKHIVGAEVVPPHGDAVDLVYHD